MFPVKTLLLILFYFIDEVFCSRSSVVSTKSSIITISKLSSRNNKFEYVRDYLNRYGYFNGQDGSGLTIEDVNSSKFIFSLNKFQAYYKLEITQTINDETLKVMKTPRCGMTDIAASFNLKGMFWRKDPILWHFCGATNKQIKLATVAFQLLEKYANINFQQSFENPNIIISFKYKDHLKEPNSKRRGITLDNNELAHAYFLLRIITFQKYTSIKIKMGTKNFMIFQKIPFIIIIIRRSVASKLKGRIISLFTSKCQETGFTENKNIKPWDWIVEPRYLETQKY
ncbi:hypothetical protein FQA39_LY15036 [Lamprigera yunnana]|nr:hypothetical protein FQA39_LY15036 [Lamprigera yunnana]